MKLLDQSAKTNWKFIAIVAVVALFLGGGVWWYGKMLTEADVAQEHVRDSVREDEQENETAGWQTYRNDEFGFEFAYPAQDFRVSTQSANEVFQLESIQKSADGPGVAFIMNVEITPKDEARNFEDELVFLDESLGLAWLRARFGKEVRGAFYGDPPRGLYVIWLPFLRDLTQGVRFSFDINQLDYPGYGGSYRYRNTAKQILATFRFVDKGIVCSLETLAAVQTNGDWTEPRFTPSKPTHITIQPGYSPERLHLKFHEGTGVRLRGDVLVSLKGFDLSPVEALLDDYSELQIGRLFSRLEEEIDQDKARIEAKSGRQQADLNLYYRVTLAPGADALKLLNDLNALCIVEAVYPEPLASPPPDL